MRFIIDVPTGGRDIEEIRKRAFKEVRKLIEKRTVACSECKTDFIPEKRGRKKYCGDKCRWVVGNRLAMKRYYDRKKKNSKRS